MAVTCDLICDITINSNPKFKKMIKKNKIKVSSMFATLTINDNYYFFLLYHHLV